MKQLYDQMREIVAQNLSEGYTLDDDGVTLTNGEAMQVVAALEQLTYPPVVRGVLALLEYGMAVYDWAAIDGDGKLYEFNARPNISKNSESWYNDHAKYKFILQFTDMRDADYKTLLFHCQDDKWTWVCKPS